MHKNALFRPAVLLLTLLALAPAARASNTYTTGDLLLGFELSGNANDYVVDIGPASLYINAAPGSSFNVNTTLGLGNLAADLSAVFGSGWATNTGLSLVNWGIAGATSNTATTFGLPKNTLFFTVARDVPGTQTTPLAVLSNGQQTPIDSTFRSFASGFNGSDQTANSSFATIESAAAGNSWSAENPSSNAFGSGYDIEQGAAGTNIGPTNSVLDLYELQPAAGGGPGIYLGDFTLSSTGQLTFLAVPEPSSLTALLGGAPALALFRPRRRQAAL